MTGPFRLRIWVGCVVLLGIAFVQDPGFLVPDTKFDLVISPGGFLGRALHLWDGDAAFGQVQNQAYGYLWPMGPFFLLGALIDVPGWVVQRLWWALVMGVAFSGAARVARALGIRSDLACLVAGFAFSLSPRMLTTMGPISIEAWPSALAPWVLLPLVHGSLRGSPRRAAALSALAISMVGGVNAAATFAVVPLGALWLLTRSPGPRRRALLIWWPVFTALGTLWWLVPLLLLGAYSPPFLDFIETTDVTTFPTTLFDTLRGTSNWVPYIDPASRAGNDLIVTSYLVLNSAVLVVLGLVGLMLRRAPHRQFLALTLFVGVLMVTAGHTGVVEGWFAPEVRSALDGALAPLRNVHKFDPLVRLPLVLGLAVVIDAVTTTSRQGLPRANKVAVVSMALAALVGSALPAALGRVAPAGATPAVPDHWREAARWLAEDTTGGTALVVPGAPFADYVWGAPRDEPLQYLAESRWAVRNVIPLTPPGNIRMLDEVERRLAQGDGSPGLTDYLRRGGVEYLVVRNDLRRTEDLPDPVLVHQALAESPGLTRVTSFGPQVGGGAELDGEGGRRVIVNGGWQASYPAVEVYRVGAEAVTGSSGTVVAATDPPVVVGGPEDLVDLVDLGVVGPGPTVLAADAGPLAGIGAGAGAGDVRPPGQVVLTDGLRARERFFARIHDGYSPVLGPGDERRTGNPARDYLPGGSSRWSTTAMLDGAEGLSASSSASDATAGGGARRGRLPFAAVDADLDTQWVSDIGRPAQSWWQVRLDRGTAPTSVVLTGGEDAPENQVVRVRTDGGVSEPTGLGPGQRRTVQLPDGSTTRLRVEDASGAQGRLVALAEVDLPGLVVRRSLNTPTLPAGWGNPDVVVLRADTDRRKGCVTVATDVRCVAGRDVTDEEAAGLRRLVTLDADDDWTPDLQVQPLGGADLDALVLREQPISIDASSVAVPDPRGGAVAALDNDPSTTWMGRPDDLRPTLRLQWLGEQSIRSLGVELDDETAARVPVQVRLSWPQGSRVVDLRNGRATFAPIRTDQLRIQVERADDAAGLDFDARSLDLGVGITELSLGGLGYLPLGLSADPVTLPCGTGPDVELAGRTWSTAPTASSRELLAGVPVPASLCDAGVALEDPEVALSEGVNTVAARPSAAFAVESVTLRGATTRLGVSGALPARGEQTGPATRRIEPPGGADIVGLHENANLGWEATQDGAVLAPVVLDGWQQGWVMRDDATPVLTRFAPDRVYRFGLLVGLVLLIALWSLCLLGRRRQSSTVPSLADRRVPGAVVVASGVLSAGLIGGWVGAVVAVGTCALVLAGTAWLKVRHEVWACLLAAPVLVVGAWYAVRPWGSATGWAGADSWTGYVMVVSLVAVAVAVRGGVLPTRPFRRWKGRSITR